MPRRPAFVLVLTLLGLCLPAQTPDPIFSPPPVKPLPAGGAESKSEKKTEGAQEAPPARSEQAKDQAKENEATLDGLLERLRQWPSRRARHAALVLAGLGEETRDRLIAGLADNDWRIQAGSAFALAEMRDKAAVEPLKAAIAEKTNRASLPQLLAALVAIDPVDGPQVVIPFLGHSTARVRRAARGALPSVLGERYVPDLITFTRSPRTGVRASALELLSRIPGQGEREEYYAALGDPEPQVAAIAMRHLADLGRPPVRKRLLELGRDAPMRQATYAMLSLALLEDRHGEAVIPQAGRIRQRAEAFLRSDDPFYQGAGAVVLSNLSYRSDDATLRELANRYLVPLLLGTVAGGVFFSDYTALEALCWSKLSLLSGIDYGQDAGAWRRWWESHHEGFVARRELRSLDERDLARARVVMVRTRPDGQVSQVVLSGDATDLLDVSDRAPLVLGQREGTEILEALRTSRFFESHGDSEDPDRVDGTLELIVRVPAASTQFRRLHYGPVPETLRPLCDLVERLEAELAWQRLIPAESLSDRRGFLEREEAFFAAEENPGRRLLRLLQMAIAAYPTMPRQDRHLALAVFRRAPPEWVAAERTVLSQLLRHENKLTDEAAELVGLLATTDAVEVRNAVLDLVSASPSLQGDQILRGFLSRQPLPGITGLMRDGRPRVRAVAAESLQRFQGDSAVVDLLIEGLKDYEPQVRDACLRSLASMKDERVLTMLETVLAGGDQAMKLRAIEALGAVGREQSVTRLMEVYRAGDRHTRWTVIRTLPKAGGRRAVLALAAIVRESGELELRREAMDALVSLGGTDVGEQLGTILERAREPEIRILAVDALGKVMGMRAIETVKPFLLAEEADVRRMALLTLARLGSVEAAPGLLAAVRALEGDAAAERALKELTFNISYDPSPPRRALAYEEWFKKYGTLSRSEWFLMAAGASGPGLDGGIDWLGATELSPAGQRALVGLLETGNVVLRAEVDRILRRVTGVDWDPVGTEPAQADQRAREFRTWMGRQPGKTENTKDR